MNDHPPDLAKRAGRYALAPAVLLGWLVVAQHGHDLGAVLVKSEWFCTLPSRVDLARRLKGAAGEAPPAAAEHPA